MDGTDSNKIVSALSVQIDSFDQLVKAVAGKTLSLSIEGAESVFRTVKFAPGIDELHINLGRGLSYTTIDHDGSGRFFIYERSRSLSQGKVYVRALDVDTHSRLEQTLAAEQELWSSANVIINNFDLDSLERAEQVFDRIRQILMNRENELLEPLELKRSGNS